MFLFLLLLLLHHTCSRKQVLLFILSHGLSISHLCHSFSKIMILGSSRLEHYDYFNKQTRRTTTSIGFSPQKKWSNYSQLFSTKYTMITKDQEMLLQSLDPNLYGSTFINKVRELLEFKNVYGSCLVPKRFKENPSLGNWVNKTRQMYRKYQEGEGSSMTPERVKLLNEIGFSWSGNMSNISRHPHDLTNINTTIARNSNSNTNYQYQYCNDVIQNDLFISTQDRLWMIQYQQLKEYYLQNDKSYSKLKSSQHSKLTSWVVRQRREYHKSMIGEKSTMTKGRIDLLEEIEFDWSPRESNWKLRVEELKEYKSHHGDCLVPVKYKENPKLGSWVSTQRKYFKLYQKGDKSRITKEKIKQLSDIGFVWNRWEHSWSDNGTLSQI